MPLIILGQYVPVHSWKCTQRPKMGSKHMSTVRTSEFADRMTSTGVESGPTMGQFGALPLPDCSNHSCGDTVTPERGRFQTMGGISTGILVVTMLPDNAGIRAKGFDLLRHRNACQIC